MRLSHSELKSLLSYDPETGIFVWLVDRGRLAKAGQEAGGINKVDGRRRVDVRGVKYLAHRLAWFWMTGGWPTDEIDHRDLDPLNNRWGNLRLATHAQNQRNSTAYKTNACGLKGVSWSKRKKRWVSQGQFERRKYHLGYFDCPDAAHAAYREFAGKLHGEFARTS